MALRPRVTGRRRNRAFAGFVALTLIASACGGTKSGDEETSDVTEKNLTAEYGESGLADAGEPKRGGKLIYGLEADTNGGFCLSEGQLAIAGMMVVRAVYDTLTVPNAEGGYSPYLAKSVTPNDDFTEWNIELREGVKFHDGSPLTAEVVKNNIDAFRGKYPGRSSLLFVFVLRNIASVDVVDNLNVKVTTTVPWVAFPSYLFSSSRLGIMAQAQLDDETNCARNPIGTGPFKFKEWTPNSKFVAEKNPDYWQIAPDGEPYPYADSIEFRPITDGQVRVQALEGGDVNVIHTSNAEDIGNKLYDLREKGSVNMFVSEEQGEVSFVQLNTSVPPFDDPNMRKALAMGADRNEINQIMNDSLPTLANGVYGPDSIGYVEDTGFPEYDLEESKRLVKEYVAGGGKAEFTLHSTTDATVKKLAQLVQSRAEKSGVKVTIVERDQAALINDAIGKKYQAMLFRNYPGGDPDSLYVWFYSGTTTDGQFTPNLVNFAGIKDDDVDRLLDEGRSEPDPDKRAEIYKELNTVMGSQVYGIWTWFTPWAIVTGPKVHGIVGPPLPGDDPSQPGDKTTDDPARQPNLGLATGHSLLGLWVE